MSRSFSSLLFDEVVSGTSPIVSLPQHDELLASMDRLSLHAVASAIAVGGTPQINVQLQHSADGLAYGNVGLASEIDRAVLASTGRTDALGAMSLAAVPLSRIRLAVWLNTGDVARVKVWVTGRKRGEDCGCDGACSEAGDGALTDTTPAIWPLGDNCPQLPMNPSPCNVAGIVSYWAVWYSRIVCLNPNAVHTGSAKFMQDNIAAAMKWAQEKCFDLGPCQRALRDGIAALDPADSDFQKKLNDLQMEFIDCISDHTPKAYNKGNDPTKQGLGTANSGAMHYA